MTMGVIDSFYHMAFKKRFYFILYSENQCISNFYKIGIFIDMKFH